MKDEMKVFSRDYAEYQIDRSRLRKTFRRILYLSHTLKYVKGKTIDFGCGVGELLSLLPAGSIGLDVNEAAVEYCKERCLDVRLYCPEIDNYRFNECEINKYRTFVMSHVLEHMEHPAGTFRLIAKSCLRLGIERIIVIVPGIKGFRFDKTHRVFIDRDYLKRNDLCEIDTYALKIVKDFPFRVSWAGRLFTYQELVLIYERAAGQ